MPQNCCLNTEIIGIANNRAYYSIFHSMRSVLTFDSFDTKKHSGVIAEFRKRYIKEGIFPVELSAMIGSAFTIRNASDYDDMFIASKSDTEQQIKNAKRIYEEVEIYVKKGLMTSSKIWGKKLVSKWCPLL